MKAIAPLLRILAVFAIAIAGLAMSQERLLYFPDKAEVAELSRFVSGAQPWPAAGDFRALLVEPVGREARATIIVFHGNAGHGGHRSFYAEALVPLGWRVILAEYPGYGPRAGALGEESLVADAAETIARIHKQFGEPAYLLGESLGAGVAAAASVRLQHKGIAGLVLVTPWDSLSSVASYHYPWLPVRWLLRDQYDSVTNLAGFSRRTVVVLAENDSVVPARFGKLLFDALNTEKRLLILKSADHNDWTDHVGTDWWLDLDRWLRPAAAGMNVE